MGVEELLPLVKVIVEVGVGVVMSGVVVLVLFYTIRITIPDVVDKHTKAVTEIVNRHKDESKQIREDNKNEQRQSRDDFKEALKTVVDHCQKESAIRDDIMRREVAENTAAIVDLRRTLEDLREAWLTTTADPRTRQRKGSIRDSGTQGNDSSQSVS